MGKLGFQPERDVRRWGEYLNFLNAFYLLPDSASMDVDRIRFFNLHEIKFLDAFRVSYEHGKQTSEGIAPESVASVFQMDRYSSSYQGDDSIEHDHRIFMRRIVSIGAIEQSVSVFDRASGFFDLVRISFRAAASASYGVGNPLPCLITMTS